MFFIHKNNTYSICSGIIINVYFIFCVAFNLNILHKNVIFIINKLCELVQHKGKAKN